MIYGGTGGGLNMKPYTQWAVFHGTRPLGLVETNYKYAKQYWHPRGYQLVGGYGFQWKGTEYVWKQ